VQSQLPSHLIHTRHMRCDRHGAEYRYLPCRLPALLMLTCSQQLVRALRRSCRLYSNLASTVHTILRCYQCSSVGSRMWCYLAGQCELLHRFTGCFSKYKPSKRTLHAQTQLEQFTTLFRGLTEASMSPRPQRLDVRPFSLFLGLDPGQQHDAGDYIDSFCTKFADCIRACAAGDPISFDA
jgi:hypothetical protein